MNVTKEKTIANIKGKKKEKSSPKSFSFDIYDEKGGKKEKILLPENIFGVLWNANLVHQVIVSMQSNKRQNIAHTKDRSEVSGGGAKPWRQKGTGRARHGSIRSPIWVGGGVTHGPRNERNYSKKINKKVKKRALYSILSRKLLDNEILFLNNLKFDEPKTKRASDILKNLSKIKGYENINFEKGNRVLIATPKKDDNIIRSFKNIKTTCTTEIKNINPLVLMNYKFFIVVSPKESIDVLNKDK